MTVIDNFKHFFFILCLPFLQARHLNLSFRVFLNQEFLLAVEEVEDLTAVYLEERHVEGAVATALFEDVVDTAFGCVGDCEGFAGAGLTVGEESYYAFVEESGD